MKPLVQHGAPRQVGRLSVMVPVDSRLRGNDGSRGHSGRRVQAYVAVHSFHLLHFAHSNFGV